MFGKDTVVTAVKLLIITAVVALCLAYVNKITLPVIEKNAEKRSAEALQKVLSDADSFSKPEEMELSENGAEIEIIYVGKNEDGEVVGYVVTVVSHEGYGGDVKVMVGIDCDLKVTRIEILESSETAGLGANASNPKFAGQFEGKAGGLTVVKGDAGEGQISAISSATITSKAVTNCVNLAVEAVSVKVDEKDALTTADEDSEEDGEKEGDEE